MENRIGRQAGRQTDITLRTAIKQERMEKKGFKKKKRERGLKEKNRKRARYLKTWTGI